MPDSVYGLRDRDLLALAALVLLALGLLMVQSAAFIAEPQAGPALLDWSGRGVKHALYVALAILAFVTASRLDVGKLARSTASGSPAVWFAGIAVILAVLVLIPGVGAEVNGARRWLRLGPLNVQPSELVKWGVVLLVAWRLSRPGPFELGRGFLTLSAIVGLMCLLVVIHDFGSAALIAATAGVMFLAGPVKLRWLAAAVLPAAGAAFWFVWSEPYRMRRISAFLDPWANPESDGYHVIQSLYSFAGGGWTGRGLGNGVQKLGYLPEDTTDFIFAVVCEELGLFGALLVAGSYLIVITAGWCVSRRCPDPFGRLLAFGVVAALGLQATINIAVATASLPTKGIALPLVSAGGTGLVCTGFMLGLVYAVGRGPVEARDGDWERLMRGDHARADSAADEDED
ncbi:MAG: putative peptidoglycan glycosyltransferase FtsW [Planctomycetota bacterium]